MFSSLLILPPAASAQTEDPYLLFQLAEQACKALNHGKALELLKQSFEEGYPSPSKVLSNKSFRTLRENPESRRQLRSLMKQHIRETVVTMIDPEEEGDRMVIRGTLLTADSVAVSDAVMFFYHTDSKGLYAPEHLRGGFGANNPRLFAFVKTDERGHFTVTTVRPNSYPDYRNIRHVHFEITAPRCNQISQFYLDKDPEPTPTQISNAHARNFPILSATVSAKGEYEVEFVRVCR